MSHKCPVPRCRAQISDDLLMCIGHWNKVPRELQERIYELNAVRKREKIRTYAPHFKACAEAVKHVYKMVKK